jgi:DNA-binding transcriptional ArsR family regulator
MAEYVLKSLSEAKEISRAISNKTSQKILDYLSGKEDATESKISKDLDVPLSTVHYSLMQLVKSGIIESEEFHYSEKGKEVNHYRLANKLIIISPKEGIVDKLKTMLPVSLMVLGLAAIIQLTRPKPAVFAQFGAAGENVETLAMDTAVAPKAAPELMRSAQFLPSAEPNLVLWFIIGAAVTIALIMLVDYIRQRTKF